MAHILGLQEIPVLNEKFAVKFKDLVINKKKNIVSRRVWDAKGHHMADIVCPLDSIKEQYNKWLKEPCTTVQKRYQCPDGFYGTMERIWTDIENGILHGCSVGA